MFENIQAESIEYSFDAESLVDGLDESCYDIDASIQLFQDLCIVVIREEFTNADVNVESSGMPRVVIDGNDNHPDSILVELHCDELRQSDKWQVEISQDQLLDVLEASREFGIPVAVIRQGCINGSMQGATDKASRWLFSRRSLHTFQSLNIQGDSGSLIWQISDSDISKMLCTGINDKSIWHETLHEISLTLAELFVIPDELDLPIPFSTANSHFHYSVENKSQMSFILHTDVEDFHHPKEISFTRYSREFIRQAKLKNINVESQSQSMCIVFSCEDIVNQHLNDKLLYMIEKLHQLCDDVAIALDDGPIWKNEYHSREKIFCEEVLQKLLEKMEFSEISNVHGTWEFGKDFTFTETTSFGLTRYYALQAKAGNISGAINPNKKGKVDGLPSKVTPLSEILEQLDDAFSVPYQYQGTSEHRFISIYIIAISGYMTENAKEKLWWKLQRQGRVGMVYVWDKAKIQELIRYYWIKNRSSSEPVDWSIGNHFFRKEI